MHKYKILFGFISIIFTAIIFYLLNVQPLITVSYYGSGYDYPVSNVPKTMECSLNYVLNGIIGCTRFFSTPVTILFPSILKKLTWVLILSPFGFGAAIYMALVKRMYGNK